MFLGKVYFCDSLSRLCPYLYTKNQANICIKILVSTYMKKNYIRCLLLIIGFLAGNSESAAYILENFDDEVDGLSYGVSYDYNDREYYATVKCLQSNKSTVTIPEYIIAEQGNSGAKVRAIVKDVASGAFRYINSLPDDMQYGGRLREIVFESDVSIGKEAFKNLPNLKVVDFGPIDHIAYGAFKDCTALEEIKSDNSLKSIGALALSGSTSLKILPPLDELEWIGASAFENCKSIVTLPEMPALESIGDNAFHGCDALRELPPLPLLSSIGNGAFQYCYDLMAIQGDAWPVKEIGNNAFDHCTSLSIIPKFIDFVTIGDYAFANCSRLTELDAAPISVGKYAFNSCLYLNKVKSSDLNLIPENGKIGESAFSGLPNFSELNSMRGVTEVGATAFFECRALESLDMVCNPVGNSIFSGCRNLTSIKLDGNDIPDSLFYGCENLLFDIQEEVTHIGKYAFANCKKLDSIKIPEDMLIIEMVHFGDAFLLR